MPKKAAHPKLDKAFEEAKKAGTEAQFLKEHPKYAKQQQPVTALSKLPKETQQVFEAEKEQAKETAIEAGQMYNPTQNLVGGSQNVTFDPETGQPTVTQTLDPYQQNIYEQGAGLTSQGQQMAAQQLGAWQPFGMTPESLAGMRSQVEDAIFAKLTQDLDKNYQEAKASKEQELWNKGIPFSGDPNSRYQQELGAIEKNYSRAQEEARNRAISEGGTEMQRQFGMGLQSQQQGMADIRSLQGMGTGLTMPQFQGFQAPGYSPAGVFDIWSQQQQFGMERPLTQAEIDLKRAQTGYYGAQTANMNKPEEDTSILYG